MPICAGRSNDLCLVVGLINVKSPESVYKDLVALLIQSKLFCLCSGGRSGAWFADPSSAQHAASLLGVSQEDLARIVFGQMQSLPGGNDDFSDILEGFIMGLYDSVFTCIVNLINR